jgi:large subunit ribosomal protein L18
MPNRNRANVRKAIHQRIRRKVRGSTVRPRLAIYRSTNHIYAQIIDDERGQTVASASSTEKDLRGAGGGNIEAAKRIGRMIAERAQAAGVKQVVFDRGGYLYHGRIKALTDAAREAGLNPEEAKPATEPAAADAGAKPSKGEGKTAKGEGKAAKGEAKAAKGEAKPAKKKAAPAEVAEAKAAPPADETKPAEDLATPAATEATPATTNEAGAEQE